MIEIYDWIKKLIFKDRLIDHDRKSIFDRNHQSPQTNQLCSLYFMFFNNIPKFSLVSFICTECATSMERYLFPLCQWTAFKLALEELLKTLHSVALCSIPKNTIKPAISLQNTMLPFSSKNGKTSFSQWQY